MANALAPFGGPVAVLVYGEPGFGKSTDCAFSFCNALYVGDVAGLRGAATVCGYTPKPTQITQVRTIPQATELVAKSSGRFDAVVIDDFTLMSEATFSDYEDKYTGFNLFGAMRKTLLKFRETMCAGSCHVIVNGHERTCHEDKLSHERIKGGPRLPGKMSQELPGTFDLILRVVPSPYVGAAAGPMGSGGIPPAFTLLDWKNVYYNALTRADDVFVTKDRLNVCWEATPMNLGEILRARGYAISRHASMPWQEEIVEHMAQALVPSINAGAPAAAISEIMRQYRAYMETQLKAAPWQVHWTFRDGLCRALLRVALDIRQRSAFGGA
jgi:hypothetical protein